MLSREDSSTSSLDSRSTRECTRSGNTLSRKSRISSYYSIAAYWNSILLASSTPASSLGELLERPDRAAFLLSKACLRVFEGDSGLRTVARTLDYLAYGLELSNRSLALSEALMDAIGDRLPGDPEQSADDEVSRL